jgi:uncharacterized membrane protein HdeD (DUF308 family)
MARNSRQRKTRSRQVARKGPRQSPAQRHASVKSAMVFTRQNYLLMLVGVVLIVVGYTIMRMENEVDGVISLYVAPLIILGGYLEIIYAILWRPQSEKRGEAEPEATA